MGQCPKCGANTDLEQATCSSCGVTLAAGPRPVEAGENSAVEGRTPPAQAGRPGREKPARSRRAGRAPRGTVLPLSVALIATILLQQLINVVVPADAYLYRLFRPSGGWLMAVVPALIAFSLIWTLTDLILKFRLARRSERDLLRPEVQQLPLLVAKERTSVTRLRLRSWDRGLLSRPVGRRVLWLLQHLDTADPQRAHELVRHQTDLDSDTAASAYRTVKLFIWAMPILGFIGTVLGISLAVGGFSDFLTTSVSIDEIDSVTAELGEVASGLSFAFDTTLLGLLAGLISTVVSTGVHAREERMLTRLEELGLRVMADAKPVTPQVASDIPATDQSGGSPGEELSQMLHARLDDLSGQMDRFTSVVRSELDGFATSLGQVSTRMTSGIATSVGSVGETVDGLGDNVQGVAETLARGMAGMEQANQRLESALATSSDQVAEASDRLLAGAQSQAGTEEAVQALVSAVEEFGSRLDDIKQTQAVLAPVLQQLAGPLELRLTPVKNERLD
jgi:biopolymer transport protein ExbB/TolQ